MKPVSSFLCFLPLALCLSLFPYLIVAQQTKSNASPNLIQKACQNSPHKEFCVASLESAPNSKQTDLNGLAFIALKLASSTAQDTIAQISKLLNESDHEPFIEQCLTDCSEHYMDAVDQVDDSLAALSVHAFDDINTWMNAAIADAQSCEEGFKEQTGHPLVLTHNNKNFRQLCNNALFIAKQLTEH